MTDSRRNFEFIRLWFAAKEGDADAEQLRRLNEWLENDPQARKIIFEVSQHQGWLAWHGISSPGAAIPVLDDSKRTAEVLNGQVPADGQPSATRASQSPQVVSPLRRLADQLRTTNVPLLSFRMAALVGFVFLLASLTRWGSTPEVNLMATDPPVVDLPVQANVLTLTPCLWNDSEKQVQTNNRQFTEGDAVKLLEGVAELSVTLASGPVDLQVEGPVSFVLGNQGITNLQYGKITVDNHSANTSSFVVETSLGRVLASPGSEVGISAFGSLLEIHAFQGSAILDSPWLVSDSGELTSRPITTHRALRVAQRAGTGFKFTEMDADRSLFTPQRSLQASYLDVHPDYVATVMDTEPVAYWRFEGSTDQIVKNEMGGGFDGTLMGDYRWVGPEHSRSIQFGVLPHPGMMRVRDNWDKVLESNFAYEMWIRPSHYHHGTMVSFAGPFNWDYKKNPLGICVETMGGWGDGARTNRLRFLVRAPLGHLVNSSIYSERIYSPQNWQHVVAQRDGAMLELYLDGELVQSRPGKPDTPPGLELIVGKLYTDEVYRPYSGCVDELSIYDRELSASEIRAHYQAMHLEKHDSPDT
ncbi:LamG domain-containing protein [Aeoliella sp. ICT_H6.2]|uniref:LamG domain-containing protein n=1 Tax=Aeoliella straminimaris TaxID=2954799 RepID=A0A9X2FF72_9BACT|nr:LamG domain-containing protein [Aeoliella straminimaris]MCO6047975.1 LamG domain-containing protein [Aeoliella straminimaris]